MTIVAAVAPPGVSALLASISTGLQSAQQLDRWYRDNREFFDTATQVIQSASGTASNVVQYLSQDEPLSFMLETRRDAIRSGSRFETPDGPTSLSVGSKRLRISPRRDWFSFLRGAGAQSKRRRFRFSVRRTYPRSYRRRRSLRRRF